MDGRIVVLASKAPGLAVLRSIGPRVTAIVTMDDSADPRSVLAGFRDFARETGRPICVTKPREAEAEILALQPDLCVVCGWYRILGSEFLKRVPRGVVGLHHSLLPRYRGGAPLVWALINGEREVGTSLFYFTEGMDDGDIVDQRSVAVGGAEYIGEVLPRLEALDVEMLSRHLHGLLEGTAPRRRQEEHLATYATQRSPEDGRIDWSWPAPRIFDFVRAQSDPYPGAWCLFEGQRLSVWRAMPVLDVVHGPPGRVFRVASEGVTVCCGNASALRLTELGGEGRRGAAHELIPSASARLG